MTRAPGNFLGALYLLYNKLHVAVVRLGSMRTNPLRRGISVVVALLVVGLFSPSQAHAAPSNSDRASSAYAAISRIAPEVTLTEQNETDRVATTSEAATGLQLQPLTEGEPSPVLSSVAGSEVKDFGADAEVVKFQYTPEESRHVIVINGPQAPSRYEFALPDEVASVEVISEKMAVFKGRDGEYLGGVAPVWAKDNAGKELDTKLLYEGGRLIQEINHSAGAASYPIVADPFLGKRLFDDFKVNRKGKFKNQNVYSGHMSLWGHTIYQGSIFVPGGAGAGLAIINNDGWKEFRTTWPGPTNTTAMHQQFICHTIGGYPIIGSGRWWDLEVARGTNKDYANLWSIINTHQCNW